MGDHQLTITCKVDAVPVAFDTVSFFLLPFRRLAGTAISRVPARYCPVRLAGSARATRGLDSPFLGAASASMTG